MIVMIKTMNVNMDVAAENPGGITVEGNLFNLFFLMTDKQ